MIYKPMSGTNYCSYLERGTINLTGYTLILRIQVHRTGADSAHINVNMKMQIWLPNQEIDQSTLMSHMHIMSD